MVRAFVNKRREVRRRSGSGQRGRASSILQHNSGWSGFTRSLPCFATWYVPTQYLNPGAWRLCCSWTENRCNPGSSWETEAERAREWERERERESEENGWKKLPCQHIGGGDSYKRGKKGKGKRGGDCVILVLEQLVFRREGILCPPPLSSLSFSLFLCAGGGRVHRAVPGLVTCPSIPQELWQGHCDRYGDCENRTRQGDRGTVTHAE